MRAAREPRTKHGSSVCGRERYERQQDRDAEHDQPDRPYHIGPRDQEYCGEDGGLGQQTAYEDDLLPRGSIVLDHQAGR